MIPASHEWNGLMKQPMLAALALAAIALLPQGANAQATVNICNRTQQVEDAILAKVAAANCASVPVSQLAGMSGVLSISYASISTLQSGDFDNLTSLTWLSLGGNQLATLPDGIFDSLTSLTLLGLSGNQLATLPAGIFDSLTRLRALDLRENRLAGLQANDPLFSQLPEGVEIHLRPQREPPEPPVAIEQFEDAALDLGERLEVSLSGKFRDPEGGDLTYRAESSAPSVVRVRIENGSLIAEAVGEGVAALTITATDGDGLSATLRFAVQAERTARSRWRNWRLMLLGAEGGGAR